MLAFILKGNAASPVTLEYVEEWVELYPQSLLSFDLVTGMGIRWHLSSGASSEAEARKVAKLLDARAEETTSVVRMGVRRLLVLANISLELSKTQPDTGFFPGLISERKSLVRRRNQLLESLKGELHPRYQLLRNVLEIRARMTDIVDEFHLSEAMKPEVLMDRVNGMLNQRLSLCEAPVERASIESLRAHFMHFSTGVILSRERLFQERGTEFTYRHPRPTAALLRAAEVACYEDMHDSEACDAEATFCSAALFNLLCAAFYDVETTAGIYAGELFLKRFADSSRIETEEVYGSLVSEYLKHGKWDRARELLVTAAKRFPENTLFLSDIKRIDLETKIGGHNRRYLHPGQLYLDGPPPDRKKKLDALRNNK